MQGLSQCRWLIVNKVEGRKRDVQRSGGKERTGPYRPWRGLHLAHSLRQETHREIWRELMWSASTVKGPPYGENRKRAWKQVDQSGLEVMVAWTKVVAMGVMRNKFPNVFQRWYDLLIGWKWGMKEWEEQTHSFRHLTRAFTELAKAEGRVGLERTRDFGFWTCFSPFCTALYGENIQSWLCKTATQGPGNPNTLGAYQAGNLTVWLGQESNNNRAVVRPVNQRVHARPTGTDIK